MRVSGAPASNPSRLVGVDEPVALLPEPPRFVSRGGEKLAAALARFEVDPTGWRVLDAGASTGGFTDCVLQAGARSVVAVDVGRGQLHRRLETDPRVESIERTNLRHLDPLSVGAPFDLVVADLSFISLSAVARVLVSAVGPQGRLICLVKPQFEASRAEVDAGRGVIADPAIHRRTLGEAAATMQEAGAAIIGAMKSPLKGNDGNVEFFLNLVVGEMTGPDVDDLLDRAVDERESR
ncbi:MAG: TlyA family RNA methyltransferase [Acidimicrobiales bacterium]|nr:TlyA family RNA methyltransferase [Acidimicrobiales bacterium]